MSKKYFGTDGIRAQIGQRKISPDSVLKLGWAAGKVFARSGASVLIGKDTRISGYMIESALEAGLAAAGVNVALLGPLPTPGIAYLTRTLRAQAGIVISASHNRYPDNGIKFFSDKGFKLSDDIEYAIEDYMEQPLVCVLSHELGKATRITDAQGRYIEFCKSSVPLNMRLDGMKIVLDCAHGATYHVAPCVFHELGAEVISLFNNPDGFNINETCGSTQPETLRQKVLAECADLGIAFDGDGDRVILVDHLGEIVDGDEILYIMMNHLLKRNALNGGIVGTVMSNCGLQWACQDNGVPFHRVKVGDRYVMEALLDQDWQIGGEPSGHVVNLAKTTSGDGIITALEILVAMQSSGQSLHALKSGLNKLPQTLINIQVDQPSTVIAQESVQKAIDQVEKKLKGRGRVLLRPSGTEPVVRIMVEGENEIHVNQYAQDLAALITNEQTPLQAVDG